MLANVRQNPGAAQQRRTPEINQKVKYNSVHIQQPLPIVPPQKNQLESEFGRKKNNSALFSQSDQLDIDDSPQAELLLNQGSEISQSAAKAVPQYQKQKVTAPAPNQVHTSGKFILRVDSESSPDHEARVSSNKNLSQDRISINKLNSNPVISSTQPTGTEKNSTRDFKRKVNRSRRSDSENGSVNASNSSVQGRYNTQPN